MEIDGSPEDWKSRIVCGTRVGDPDPPDWLGDCYATFRSYVTDARFPCYFASEGERAGKLFYSHVSAHDVGHLPQTILTFLGQCKDLSRDKNNLTVFFEPRRSHAEHHEYRKMFWDTLCHLHDHDPHSRTAVDRDPSDPLWEFPFANHLFFVVGLSPSYRQRRSRNLGPGMIMVFQPRQVFQDALTGRDISSEARGIIRERLVRWDGNEAHPDLNMYGKPGNLEWVQYFFSDDGVPENGRCPLSLRARHGAAAAPPDANSVKLAQSLDRS